MEIISKVMSFIGGTGANEGHLDCVFPSPEIPLPPDHRGSRRADRRNPIEPLSGFLLRRRPFR